MKRLITGVALCVVSVALSGCLATVATVGSSLALGVAAGCENASRSPGANKSRVDLLCGKSGR